MLDGGIACAYRSLFEAIWDWEHPVGNWP